MSKTIKTIDKIFIEDPRRAIVIGASILVAIILIVVFWGRIRNLFANLKNALANKSALTEWSAQTGEVPTLSQSQFVLLCNQLEQAAKGVGTDEQAIYNVFNQMGNTADVYKLISVYGTRDGKDLPTMIRSELSSVWPFNEISKLNKILANKGISYSF